MHSIEVIGREEREDVTPESSLVVCTAGRGHPCGEDLGGCGAWEQLKEAYRTETPDEYQRERMQWYEQECMNGDELGLKGKRVNLWDRQSVNDSLARFEWTSSIEEDPDLDSDSSRVYRYVQPFEEVLAEMEAERHLRYDRED